MVQVINCWAITECEGDKELRDWVSKGSEEINVRSDLQSLNLRKDSRLHCSMSCWAIKGKRTSKVGSHLSHYAIQKPIETRWRKLLPLLFLFLLPSEPSQAFTYPLGLISSRYNSLTSRSERTWRPGKQEVRCVSSWSRREEDETERWRKRVFPEKSFSRSQLTD